jgi:hypothetical protein
LADIRGETQVLPTNSVISHVQLNAISGQDPAEWVRFDQMLFNQFTFS